MALKNNPTHQFLADLEKIPFYGREQIHRGLDNLGNRMKVGGNNDRLSSHPEAIDLESNNSISYELEQVCATMIPRPFVYHKYVCHNCGTTLPQYLKRCALWGRRYNRFPGWFVDTTDTPFENVNGVRFRSGTYGNNNINGPPDEGNGPPPGNNHGDNGGHRSLPNNDNNNTSSNMPPIVGTHANPMQANIRPRTAGRNIRSNEADNDDISYVSSTSSKSKENEQPENSYMVDKMDDNSWDTDMAERNAPLGKYRKPLIPPYSVSDSWVKRNEW
jgi:hypothetical protein